MPAAVAIPLGVAALGAASKYGAATSGSRAAREAAAAQERSTSAALDYQKGRDTLDDKRKAEAWADYQRRHDAWEQRNFGAKSGASAAAPTNMDPVAVAARAAVSPGGRYGPDAAGPNPTLRDMAPGAVAPPAPEPAPAMGAQANVSTMPTIADTARWEEWAPYLAQGRA